MTGGIGQPSGVQKGNLPVQLTSFVGRQPELDTIAQTMSGSRLSTLVGPGGVGKTRLAVAAAAKVHRAFGDGVWFVDLSTLRDPALLAEHVAASLGLRDESGRWLVATLSDHLAARRMLIVFDNCEHLLDAAAVLVRALLSGGTGLRIIATSREPLALTGESLIHVSPLAVDGAALQLLVDRATAVQPTFRLTESIRHTAIELCRRLDGMPLAIELAAARLRGMGLDEVLARLDDRFSLLTSGDRSGPVRQQTLRAALDWSYDLLPPLERMLLWRLSAFTGTFDLAAATAICTGGELRREQIPVALSHLAERSLVQLEDPVVGRYRLLETVRDYSVEKAIETAELEDLLDRHRDHFLAFAQQAIGGMATADQLTWFGRVSTEYDNLRQALKRSRHSAPAIRLAADVAAHLWLWWQVAGRIGEGRRWISGFLDSLPAAAPERRMALFAAGFLALTQRDMEPAQESLDAALSLAQETGDEEVAAYATGYLALIRLFSGAANEAREMFRSAVDRHRRGERPMMAAFSLADAAIAATIAGRPELALADFDQSIREAQAIGDTWTESHALWGLGLAQLALGAAPEAKAAMQRALELITRVGDATGQALALEGLAVAVAANDDYERAAWLTGLADGFWAAIPASPPAPVIAIRDSGLADARRSLGERRFQALVATGRTTDVSQAVVQALGARPSAETPSSEPVPVLSRREQEVAALVASGLTNRAIAEQLVLSPRTVESHVQRILNRLGVNSRTEIAAWVARQSHTT